MSRGCLFVYGKHRACKRQGRMPSLIHVDAQI